MSRKVMIMLSVACALGVSSAQAGEVAGLTTFTAGTAAKADEVNGNFSSVKTAVDDNHAQLAALQATIAELTRRLEELESSQVMALNQYLTVDSADFPRVLLTGVNLQIVNGMDRSDSANGLGNLLLGYDEERATGDPVCSLGADAEDVPIADEGACTAAGQVWALNHKSGSHYLVIGREHNYSRWSGMVVGWRNTANNNYASVSGGGHNDASGFAASVSGGSSNSATNMYSSVSGGANNSASASGASVSGGGGNTASAPSSTVSGGYHNAASEMYSTVSGGRLNTAEGRYSTVSGGASRTAAAESDWAAGALLEDL